MNFTASAFQEEPLASLDVSLSNLFEPIAEELEQTQALYQETVLQTSESSYIQQLLSGDGISFIPQEFRVTVADQIAHHLLKGEGKWIRSALVLLTADACGLRDPRVHQVAVAVELIHLATLVHDDIIDEAPMRRGVESVSGGWGNKIAVLLGDFLFSKAFKLLLASGSIPSQNLLTRATGQMCLGEIKQLCFSHQQETTEAEYLEMIDNKTASLMAAATAAGAHLGGISEDSIHKMHGFGHDLGMAFQITDDVLDYTASTVTLGKESGVDFRNGKSTLPLIHLLKMRGDDARSIISGDRLIEEQTNQLLTLMQEIGSVEYAYNLGRRYGETAKQRLGEVEEVIGTSASLNSLYNLVDFILTREK